MTVLRRLSARTPLRVKLIAAVLLLVMLALLVISTASVLIMRRQLLDQADRRLIGTAQRIARTEQPPPPRSMGQYVVEVHTPDGRLGTRLVPSWRDSNTLPAIPADAGWLTSHVGRAVTVHSVSGGASWRVFVQSIRGGGTIAVAVDLHDASAPIRKMIGADIVVGSIVLVLIAGLGVVLIRATLGSLVRIEHTAQAIAAGDLSRRVPDADQPTEIGRLGSSLNGMLSQIETAFHAQARSEATARESEERMRRFIADASHELRTPLSVIRGFAEYYRQRDDVDRAELNRLVGRVEDEAARMGVLIEDLLLLARLDQQRPLAQKPVDLLALAADAVHDARVLDGEREISLTVRGGSAFIVTGDDIRLRQVIGNLVGNALRHTPAGTPIEVLLRPDGQSAVLEVIDTGPGMPPEQAQRVFERFYRADPARSRGGTGLGLSIVAGLVQAHGGTVEVETAPGQGATFRVTLPLDPETADELELDSDRI